MLSLSCPSCNTAFTLPAAPADRRAECPRCHDVFPVRDRVTEGDQPEAAVAPAPASFSAPPDPRSPNTSFTRAAMIAGALGLIGLSVGLWVSRGEKPRPEPDAGPQRPAAVAVPAAELRGLAYLPADTNVVFAAQPGPFVAYAERTKQDPTELIAQAGLSRSVLKMATDLGLSLDQIDHVAGGTHVGGGAFDPRLTLALVLRQPHSDEDEFLKRLKAKKQPGANARYDGSLGALPVTVVRVSPTVWVFGLEMGSEPAKNLAAVDREYGPGGKQFPAELAEAIASRVPPDAAAWVATNDEAWAAKPGVEFLVKNERMLNKPEWMPSLARGRAGVAAVSLGDEPRLRLFVRTADEESGRRARDYFRTLATDPKATHGGAGTIALFETPIDPAAAYATLRDVMGEPAKK